MSDCYDIPAKEEVKEMKSFNVEFYDRFNDIWASYDELHNIECDDADEAIDLAINWCIENDVRRGDIDYAVLYNEYVDMTWRAAEVLTDKDGLVDLGEWEVR